MLSAFEPGAVVALAGITLSIDGPLRRYSLRARDPALLAAIIGLPVPTKIGATQGAIACLGPDEFYARLPIEIELPDGRGHPVSIVDVSARAVGILVEGDRAIEVLSAGCPLELTNFDVGRTTRTIFETVEIIVSHETETRWHVDVWRSFAPWLWQALSTVASH